MGESCRLIWTAIDWSALKPESLPNFTLLSSAMRLCVGGAVGGKTEKQRFISSERGQMPRCLFKHGISFISFIVFPLRLVPCENVDHVRREELRESI